METTPSTGESAMILSMAVKEMIILLAVLVPIWLGLLYTLVTFGIPDY